MEVLVYFYWIEHRRANFNVLKVIKHYKLFKIMNILVDENPPVVRTINNI